ncbi:MAG: lysine exporter LysO family protein [Porphyromonas sp.]|nr:lysine exporter LysO family protein [Porphyromonas sp.]
MRDNLLLVGVFLVGIILGRLNHLPLDVQGGQLVLYLLYALMFCVGLSIGNDSETLKSFRKLPIRILLLPFLTIAGSWLGGTVAALILKQSVASGIALSAGLGYYSLSSVILTEELGITVGTIALLANIIRELMAIILSHPFASWFGPYAPIAAGGATTMDVTLPFILKASGQEYLVPSIYHGFICDLSVPFSVTFFASLVTL